MPGCLPRRGRLPFRFAAAWLLLSLIAVGLAGEGAAQPLPPSRLSVEGVGEFAVNITFQPSPSSNVTAYRVYVSEVNGTSLQDLRPARTVGGGYYDSILYDTVWLGAGNISGMLPANDPRYWFQNATQNNWTLGVLSLDAKKFVPSDFIRLLYSVTNLMPDTPAYFAVTAVGPDGENPAVQPVEATPRGQPVPIRPRNEGIYASWGAILLVVLAAVVFLARYETKRNRKAYLYILPALLGLVALTFYPVVFGFYLSFTNRVGTANPTSDFIGLDNYVRVFATPDFVMVATTTLVWTLVNVFFHVTIGLFLAVMLNRRIRGRVVYRALLLLPWAVPSYITTLAWRGMFETQQGLINAVLGPFGWGVLGCGSTPCAWLTAPGSPLPLVAVIVTNVWLGFPFMMMIFSGGLQGISPELYEAADVDGLTPWQKFRRITLPLLKPTIVPASLLGFIWTFNMFNVIYLMTAGDPPVPGMRAGATDILITYVYTVGLRPPNEQGFAAAYSVVIFFMLLSFGLFYTRTTGALESFAGRAVAPTEKRRIRVPGAGFLAALSRSWRARIVNPLRTAMGSDQPEHVLVSAWAIAALGILGAFELVYAAALYTAMRFWFVVTAVHAAWFLVVGVGLLVSAAGLALRQRAGKRIAVWSLLLELLGGILAALGGPLGLTDLRVPAAIFLVAFLILTAREYTKEPDPWTRLVDAVAALKPARGNPGFWKKNPLWPRLLVHATLIAFTLFAILPILVVAGTAFGRFPAMSLRNTPLLRDVLLPGQSLPGWTFEHFRYILFDSEFFLWLRNSLLVSAGTTAIGLFLALTGAYAFSRFQFRGKRASMLSFIVVQMFPGAIILIPYYVLFYQLGLINSHLGLVVAYSVTALPFVVWFLKGFFDTIPVDLEEAAMVDGTTQIGAFWRIIVPLAKPAIAVAALFTFLSAWNEWLLAFTFMTSSDNYTLPVGVSAFVNPPQVFWNEFAAISLLVSLPVVVLFIVFQKYLVSGLTKGAVKG